MSLLNCRGAGHSILSREELDYGLDPTLPTTSSAEPQYRYSPPKICPMSSDQKKVFPVPAEGERRTIGSIADDIKRLAYENTEGAPLALYDLAAELFCEMRAYLVLRGSREPSSSCSPIPE